MSTTQGLCLVSPPRGSRVWTDRPPARKIKPGVQTSTVHRNPRSKKSVANSHGFASVGSKIEKCGSCGDVAIAKKSGCEANFDSKPVGKLQKQSDVSTPPPREVETSAGRRPPKTKGLTTSVGQEPLKTSREEFTGKYTGQLGWDRTLTKKLVPQKKMEIST